MHSLLKFELIFGELCSIKGYMFRCHQSSQETEVYFSGFKRLRLCIVIGRFRSILFLFSRVLGSFRNMTDGNSNTQSLVKFEPLVFACY